MQTGHRAGAVLARLRALMKKPGEDGKAVQAYVVPSGDEHQNEYVARRDCRRAFLSGFTGSYGTAVVTDRAAGLWTDGRYFLQATAELDENWTLVKEGIPNAVTVGAWLDDRLEPGSRVGVDPFVVSRGAWDELSKELEANDLSLVALSPNLVDAVWDDRPPMQHDPLDIYDVSADEEKWEAKLAKVREKMKSKRAEILVVTALDEIAWLFNLRGSDVDYNPVFIAYAIVTMDSVRLFVDPQKLTESVRNHLSRPDGHASVILRPYEEFVDDLTGVLENSSSRVWVGKRSSHGVHELVPKNRRFVEQSPVAVLKQAKLPSEIEKMKLANEHDAVAVCRYFAWLEREVPKGNVTEVSGAAKLLELRKQLETFKGLSFETISSSGPSGAIIHYKPSPESDRKLTTEELYLCDSGGQFEEGTTDTTRTMHFGTPTAYEKECFTLVLKGHIALMQMKFPKFTKGAALDSFARHALWNAGLDYRHGTGHGIGVFLNVHEMPPVIASKLVPDDGGIQEGMILSDEPGYYEDGAFGVRIETAMLATKAETKYKPNDTFLQFVPICFVPIQKKMIQSDALTPSEIAWVDDYHRTCRDIVGRRLQADGDAETYEWLVKETQPL